MISSNRKALSVAKKDSALGRGCLFIFFGLFAAAGGLMFWWMVFRPLSGVVLAQAWTETPCTIASSEVQVHNGDGSDTYSIDIQYDYTFADQTYHGDRYHFMNSGASSGRTGKQAVIDRYPPGLETTCWVDPGDPSQSVINRGLTLDMLWGLFCLPFLAVGVGGLLFATGLVKRRPIPADGIGGGRRGLSFGASAEDRASDADDEDDWSDDIDDDLQPDGPVELKPSSSPLGKFIGVTCLALFWNGITSFFVYQAVKSHIDGRPEWCLTFFIAPFVLVGLLLVWGIFHSFLALFIPRPTLHLDRARIPLGGSAKLEWRFSGNASIIRQLKITLVGEESATYRRGTDTVTDKHKFFQEVVYESHDPLEIPEGSVDVRIPEGVMHSFHSGNNRISWEIHLDGEIPLRPDVDAEFPITITPYEYTERRDG
ncbi:MAG: DUF3592 domain-containing protein [Planctomycetaceae bacterium]|nr:DUF3592 domain-containing protein [Planctomycetaceae bacterium]